MGIRLQADDSVTHGQSFVLLSLRVHPCPIDVRLCLIDSPCQFSELLLFQHDDVFILQVDLIEIQTAALFELFECDQSIRWNSKQFDFSPCLSPSIAYFTLAVALESRPSPLHRERVRAGHPLDSDLAEGEHQRLSTRPVTFSLWD